MDVATRWKKESEARQNFEDCGYTSGSYCLSERMDIKVAHAELEAPGGGAGSGFGELGRGRPLDGSRERTDSAASLASSSSAHSIP